MFAAGFMVFWLLASIVGLSVTAWLVRRAWRSKPTSLAAKSLGGLVAISALFGALATCLGVVKAFGAVGGESVDPSQKARILAEGIAQAMNCTTFALLIWLPSALALQLLTRRRSSAAPRE